MSKGFSFDDLDVVGFEAVPEKKNDAAKTVKEKKGDAAKPAKEKKEKAPKATKDKKVEKKEKAAVVKKTPEKPVKKDKAPAKKKVEKPAAVESPIEIVKPAPKKEIKADAIPLPRTLKRNKEASSKLKVCLSARIRKGVEELMKGKYKSRSRNYMINLLLEYALEVNPLKNFDECEVPSKKDFEWHYALSIPVSIREMLDKLGDSEQQSLNFLINQLSDYALDVIGL